jgi:hypothetical protein
MSNVKMRPRHVLPRHVLLRLFLQECEILRLIVRYLGYQFVVLDLD